MQRRTLLRTAAGGIALTTAGVGTYFATTGASADDAFTIDDASPVTTDDGNIKFVNVEATHEVVWDGFDVPVAAVAWEDVITIAPNATGSDDPDAQAEHTLYDGRPEGPADGLVHVTEFQNQDGNWGGSGEVSEELSGDEQFEWMNGRVSATIDWNAIIDPQYASANSVEDPYEMPADSVLEPEQDGETQTRAIQYEKNLYFYRAAEEGEEGVMTQGGTEQVVPMGERDGTLAVSEGDASFNVTVTNKVRQQTPSGDGQGSTGA